MHGPGGPAGDHQPAVLEEAATPPEGGHHAQVVMDVGLRLLPAQGGDDVRGQPRGLTHRVLRVRDGQGATTDGQVGDRRVVTRRPGIRHDLVCGADPQVRTREHVAAGVHRQIRVSRHHRSGRVAGGPHDQGGVELRAAGEHHVSPRRGEQLGVQVDPGPTGPQVLDHPSSRPVGDLGQDPVPGLHQMEGQVVRLQLRVVGEQLGGQGHRLGEPLHPRETATDERHRQQPRPLRSRGQGRRVIEGGQQSIADGDGFLDLLQADGLVGQARDGERPGDRSGRDHQQVVAEVVLSSVVRGDRHRAVGVVDGGRRAGHHARPAQMAAQRHDRVPRFDRSRDHLRQEGLVRHVGPRIEHGHPCFAGLQPPLQLPGGVEAGVAAAHDQDVLRHRFLTVWCLHSFDDAAR